MARIEAKVEAGQRLDFDDGLFLFEDADLLWLGALANAVRERLNGNNTYYNVNLHLNPTNICAYRCVFCAFRADPGSDRGYVLSDDEIASRARLAKDRGATEIHIVGGVHHKLPFEWYLNTVRIVKRVAPEVHIKAYTAVEIQWFASRSGRSIEWVLEQLKEAGVGSLPGGGAEIFDPEVRRQLCQHKADADTWLQIHRTAHKLGLRSTCTMLYGHVERPEHRGDHLIRLRELQDETGGFMAFVPLAFHPANTGLSHLRKAGGATDLRTIAVSRLMLDNIQHIKAYWVMLGVKIAQVAQMFGSDDLDGTVVEERITHEAGAESPRELTVAEIERIIRETGREPVERDTVYRRVVRQGRSTASEDLRPAIATR
jgi:aminodeoxyfutalosine synthase